jgi:hypothetical protein
VAVVRRPDPADVRAFALWLVALVVAFVIVFGLARGLIFAVDTTTVDAGLIATFTGWRAVSQSLLLVGRWLDARQRRRVEEARSLARNRLLRTLRADLAGNLDELVRRDRSQVVFPYLRTDVWHALADGGQLELVEDSELLDVLARAYHRIGVTADLERQIWEAVHGPDTMDSSRRSCLGAGKEVVLGAIRAVRWDTLLGEGSVQVPCDPTRVDKAVTKGRRFRVV